MRDYETKKTAGAPEPPEPPSLAPMCMKHNIKNVEFRKFVDLFVKEN